MSSWQMDRRAVTTQVRDLQSKIGCDFRIPQVVDSADGIGAEHARPELTVLDVGHPVVRKIELFVFLFGSDLPAHSLDVARRQAQPLAQQLESLTANCIHSACVHGRGYYSLIQLMSSYVTFLSTVKRYPMEGKFSVGRKCGHRSEWSLRYSRPGHTLVHSHRGTS